MAILKGKFWLCLCLCFICAMPPNLAFGMLGGNDDDGIQPCPVDSGPGRHSLVVTQQPSGGPGGGPLGAGVGGVPGPGPGSGQGSSVVTQQPGGGSEGGPLGAGVGGVREVLSEELKARDICAKCGQCAACGAMVCGCVGLATGFALGLDVTMVGNVAMGLGTGLGGCYGCCCYARQHNKDILEHPEGHSEDQLRKAKDCVDCAELCMLSACSGCLGGGCGAAMAAYCGGTSSQIMTAAGCGCCCGACLAVAAAGAFCCLGTKDMCSDCKKGTEEACVQCKNEWSKDQRGECCSTVPGACKDACGTAGGCCKGACCCCCGGKDKSEEPIVTQPRSSARALLASGVGETAVLIPGYNRMAQASSLVALQGVLLGASDQVVGNLKSLALKASQSVSEETSNFQPKWRGLRGVQLLSKHSREALRSLKSFKPRTSGSLSVFGFMDNYETNLEKKARSGRVGMSLSLTPKIKVSIAYDASKKEARKHEGINLAVGSAVAKGCEEGVSAAFALNPEDWGLTGQVAGLYSWGKVKTHRRVRHGRGIVHTKGSPDSSQSGGLARLGYNLVFSSAHSTTPYVETLVSTVTWKSYEERSRRLSCSISQNRERVVESSAGITHRWKINQQQQVQAWAAYAVGSRELAGLSSRPLVSRYPLYTVYVPGYKGRYSGTELGLNYQFVCTEDITLGFTGTTRFGSLKKLEKQTYSAFIQYLY